MKKLFCTILIFAGFLFSQNIFAQIIGDNGICSSGSATYTASKWDADYQWLVTNMTITSGSTTSQTITVTANTSTGYGYLSYYNEKQIQQANKTVTILDAVPVVAYISGPFYTPNVQYATYRANLSSTSFASSFQWILNPQLNNNLYGVNTSVLDIAFYTAGDYQLVVRAQNACGFGPYYVTNVHVY